MSLVSDAVLAAISDTLEVVLECGDVKIVRERRKQVVFYVLSPAGRWAPKMTLDEIEAADLNNKLDELLRQ